MKTYYVSNVEMVRRMVGFFFQIEIWIMIILGIL
jgi:hypothetical protein